MTQIPMILNSLPLYCALSHGDKCVQLCTIKDLSKAIDNANQFGDDTLYFSFKIDTLHFKNTESYNSFDDISFASFATPAEIRCVQAEAQRHAVSFHATGAAISLRKIKAADAERIRSNEALYQAAAAARIRSVEAPQAADSTRIHSTEAPQAADATGIRPVEALRSEFLTLSKFVFYEATEAPQIRSTEALLQAADAARIRSARALLPADAVRIRSAEALLHAAEATRMPSSQALHWDKLPPCEPPPSEPPPPESPPHGLYTSYIFFDPSVDSILF